MTAEIVELPVCARLTAAPVTGLELASLTVTVTVDIVVPSAGMLAGTAETVDVPAFGPVSAAFTASIIACTSACVAGFENNSGLASI